MRIRKGVEGVHFSWQDNFPETAKCSCGGECRLAFVAQERDDEYFVCDLYRNEAGSMWPHDAIAVAVYFCKKCLKPVTIFNQA